MQNEPDEVIKEEEVPSEMVTLSNVTEVERAGIDSQIATARRYPRSITKSLQEAQTLATLDEETAASCFYSLPRGGKRIEGPSARLAEIMLYSWGNIRGDAAVVGVEGNYITAVGTCFDLEKNTAVRVQVRRRITDSKGAKYNDDMIAVTGNAAVSIALRNAVFKVIPSALTKRIYAAARQASIGKGGTLTQKRQNAMDWFTKVGLSNDNVFALLDVKGMDDVGEEELITLRGLRTAITDGDTTVESLLLDLKGGTAEVVADKTRTGADALKRKLEEQRAARTKPKTEGAPEPEPEQQAQGGTEPPAPVEVKDARQEILDSLDGQTVAELHKAVRAAAKEAKLGDLSDLNALVKRVLEKDSYQGIANINEAAEVLLAIRATKAESEPGE